MNIAKLLLAAIMGLLPSVGTAADTLRIATFNINWGNGNLQDIGRTLQQADADVVCLQETTPVSERFLRRQFGTDYPHIVFRGHKGEYAAERFGFLSKRPLSNIRYVPPTAGLFGVCLADIRHGVHTVQLVNVHLSPFVVRRGSTFRQALQQISAVETVHSREIQTVCAQIAESQPTLVCGDFNSLSTFTAPTQLAARGFTDNFAAVQENADSKPTWQWPVGHSQIRFRIDYIFHCQQFQTVNSDVLPTTGSDHALVVSELTTTD